MDMISKNERAVLFAFCLLTAFTGCGIIPMRLSEMPDGLQYVLDHRDDFDDPDHPLRSISAGTGIDGPEMLDGCWGSVQNHVVGDASLVVAQYVRFDVADNAGEAQELFGVDRSILPWGSKPRVLAGRFSIESLENGQWSGRMGMVDYAGVAADADLVFDMDAFLAAGILSDSEIQARYTVDGDFLIVDTIGLENEGEPSDSAIRFVRFDCGMLNN